MGSAARRTPKQLFCNGCTTYGTLCFQLLDWRLRASRWEDAYPLTKDFSHPPGEVGGRVRRLRPAAERAVRSPETRIGWRSPTTSRRGSASGSRTRSAAGLFRRGASAGASRPIKGGATDAATISPEIDLGGDRRASVAFSWSIGRPLDSGEYLAFDVSTDGGRSWLEQARLRGNVDREGAWHEMHLDVTDADRLLLRFRGRMSR